MALWVRSLVSKAWFFFVSDQVFFPSFDSCRILLIGHLLLTFTHVMVLHMAVILSAEFAEVWLPKFQWCDTDRTLGVGGESLVDEVTFGANPTLSLSFFLHTILVSSDIKLFEFKSNLI